MDLLLYLLLKEKPNGRHNVHIFYIIKQDASPFINQSLDAVNRVN